MTFSIVAVDREAKEVGFAIASCNWDARRVCMAQAEVGAIASQASGNQALLPLYFEKRAEGLRPDTILECFRKTDATITNRQIGMVSFAGDVAAHTGVGCLPWAGHRMGDGFTCQGNILAGPHVVEAMAETFEQTEGALYTRLYAAIAAGEAAGGDLRGRQSAGLAIKKMGFGQPGSNTFIDFAIEDHSDPIQELGRIIGVAETLVGISMLQGAYSKAADTDKLAVLARLRGFLEDKRESRYLDAWKWLATCYHESGDPQSSVAALHEVLSICPAIGRSLQAQAERGDLPLEWVASIQSATTD